LNRLAEAQSLAEAALKINPGHLDSWYVLTLIRARQKDRSGFKQAYQQYQKWHLHYLNFPEQLGSLLVNTIGEKWRLDLEYGAWLLDEGRNAEAARLFSELGGRAPDPSKAYQWAGQLCRRHQAPDLAEAFFDRAALAGLPADAVQYEKAQLKRATGEEFVYRAMLANLLDRKELSMESQTMVGLAADALEQGYYDKAESLLRNVLSQGFENAAVCTLLALAVKYQNNIAEAVSWNLKALEYVAEDPDALINLGHLYYEQKDWRSARDYYQRALKADPDHVDVLLHLSLIALMDQDLEACIQYCDRLLAVLQISQDLEIGGLPDVARVYRWIGEALAVQNKRTLAAEALTLATSLETSAR
jgi:Tfp pilus assembly protein PilF